MGKEVSFGHCDFSSLSFARSSSPQQDTGLQVFYSHTHTHTKRWTVAHSEGRDVGVVVVADDKMTKKYGPRIASPTVKAKLLAWAKVAAKSIAAALI